MCVCVCVGGGRGGRVGKRGKEGWREGEGTAGEHDEMSAKELTEIAELLKQTLEQHENIKFGPHTRRPAVKKKWQIALVARARLIGRICEL